MLLPFTELFEVAVKPNPTVFRMSRSKFEDISVTLDILSWIYFNEMIFNGIFLK